MRFSEIKIVESSGVTNRQPGAIYINQDNPEEHLVLQNTYLLPPNDIAYQTHEELLAAIKENIPAGEEVIEENKPSSSMRAAIIAHWTDHEGNDQWRVKYTKDFATGPHGKYVYPDNGKYRWDKSSKEEAIPIKPADLVGPEFKSIPQLIQEIKQNVASKVQGTGYEDIAPIIEQAVDLALAGKVSPIQGGAKYLNVIAKYAGEYLGVIAMTEGGIRNGDIGKALDFLNLQTLAGAQVSFPDDKAGELIDSILRLPGGTEIGVSTKIKTGGGKASSLSGVYNLMSDEIRNSDPDAAEILELLATAPAIVKDVNKVDQIGIVRVALNLGLLTNADINVFKRLPNGSVNVEDLQGSPNLYRMTSTQGLSPNSQGSNAYRVYYHALGAIANDVISVLNGSQYGQFRNLIKKCLANNNYIQFLTDAKKAGNDLTLNYTSKFPAVFEGEPKIFNANYYATGQKGRLGFKLK